MPPSAVNASSTQVISSMHQDYIHGCAFDIYGRRMATCSGDRFVRVWDLTDSGEWSLVGEWQAHRGSVSMLSWGHPEFGSLIATWVARNGESPIELGFGYTADSSHPFDFTMFRLPYTIVVCVLFQIPAVVPTTRQRSLKKEQMQPLQPPDGSRKYNLLKLERL